MNAPNFGKFISTRTTTLAVLVLGLTLQPAHSNLCNFTQNSKNMFTSKDLGETRSLDPNRRGSTFAFCCVFQSQAGMREVGQ